MLTRKIRIEYSYWRPEWGRNDSRIMSRGFDSIAKAADFMQGLSVNRKSLKLLVNGKEFNWPEDANDEESLRKHLEYCLDFVEAFYDV
jgi:hypothetical protein